MSRKWLTLWCVVLGTFIAGTLFAQDQPDPRRWSIDPRMTAAISPGAQTAAPVAVPEYVNPNITTRVINSKFETLVIPPNVRPIPSTSITQSEVILETDPVNRNIMFGSANTYPSGPQQINEASIYTTDGGLTWNGTSTAFPSGGHGGDPGPTYDKNGNVIHSYLRFNGSSYIGVGAVVSTDHGATWSAEHILTSGSSDKNLAGTDDWPSSAYYGRSYVVWSDFAQSAPPIVVSYTTDGGTTWTAPSPVNTPPAGHYSQGCDVEGGVGGVVYVVWAAPTSGGSFTEDFYGFAKSTNGGATWQVTENAFDGNGIRGTFTFGSNSVRTNSFPRIAVDKSGGSRNGWIYVTTCDQAIAPAGSDPDVILHRSSDGGTTWTNIRVNQDPINNGRRQWFPAVCVDPAGGVNVVYYDSRSTTTDSSTVYMSRSLDGGNTWTDVEVADHHFQPKPISGLAGGYQGDYIGVAASNGKVWPFWADDHSGIYQVWTAGVATTENFGWVKGTVTNVSGGAALDNVAVDFLETPNAPAISNAAGFYKTGVQVDTASTTRNVTMRARKFGFRDTLIALTVTRNDTITRNFAMTPVPNGTLVVRTVRRDSSNIRSGINVLFNGGSVASGNTDSLTGIYSTVLPLGLYDVLVDPPSPYGNRRFNNVTIASGSNPLYVVVRKVVENSPLAMRDTLAVGQIHAKNLTLTNTTPDSVPYRLSDDNALLKMRVSRPVAIPRKTEAPRPFVPKGAPEPQGPAQTDSSGGPDAFGYRWIDSDSPGGPTFNWVDISGVGTPVTFSNGDDGNSNIPFPFSFPFYGNSFTSSINVCTNGFLSFTSTATDYSNIAIPSPSAPLNGIFPFWDDLYLVTSGTVYYYNDAANGRFIVEYLNVPHFSSGGPYTFEIIFTPDGTIVYQYLSMDPALSNSATIGIQDAAGSVGLQVVSSGTYVHNNLALKFFLPNASWLSETPYFGTISPNSSQNVTVTFDATDLTLGTNYNANIIMDLTHPDVVGSQLIPASLSVIPGVGPVISANPTTLTFPLTIIGTNRRDSVRVRNVGSGTPNLIISSVTTTNPRYAATATSTSIAPGDSARIRVVYTPIVPGGTDTGRVVILCNDPSNPRVDIQLSGTSIGSILLATSIDSLVKPSMQGGTVDSTRFFVRNVGTAPGNFQARAIMVPRSSPDGPATGSAIEVPMKISSSQTPINYPNDHITPSVGFAPVGNSPVRPAVNSDIKPLDGVSRILTANAYGYDYRTPLAWTNFDPQVPGTLTALGSFSTTDAVYAGDFTMDGSRFLAIKGATNQLIDVNITNGTYTAIGPVTIDAGHTWTSAKFDPTSGTFYAVSTDITVSSLYTIDPATGTTTRVATITNMPAIIGMAIQPGTGQMYGYDIVGDNFYSIDKVTGTGTLIGPIGFNANLAQDMAFDRQSGVLYMCAYDGTNIVGQIRTVNLATGGTTLVGQLGTAEHLIDPFSIQGSWGASANWLSIAPTSGSIALADSIRFTATFDATSPAIYNLPGNYYGSVQINTVGAPAPDTLKIPARMFVIPPPGARLVVEPDTVNIGNVEIGVTDSSKSILVRNIGASTLTVTGVTFTGSSGFAAGRTSFTLPSLDTLRVKVKFTASAPGGVRTAHMNFTCNDPNPQSVGLRAVSVGVPHIVVRPDTFYYSLPINGDTTRTNFRVLNTGTDTLHYQISESTSRTLADEAASIARSKVQHEANNLSKGAIDPTPGERDSSGGPDAFGYRWIDSDTPGGPTFNWVDISGVGTAITTWTGSADDGYATVPFPFSFSFYGTTFSGNINVCTNGFLSFTSTLTSYSNTAIPSASAPLNGLFPFWDDLYLITSGTVYYYNDVANNRFIVEYLNVPHFSSGGPYTFEAIFKPDGSILYQYLSMDLGTATTPTIGIQDAAGAVALQVEFNSTYLHNNLAVLITSDLIPWMSTDRTFGTIAPGDSNTVSLRIHPTAPLPDGHYVGYQKVTGNTPDVKPVAVTLDAIGTDGVTLNSPNGGEQWVRGQSYPIVWTKSGAVDTVKLEYSLTGNTGPWLLITSGTPARIGLQRHPKSIATGEQGGEWDNPNGTFNWLIPANTTPSTTCFVRVSWKSNPTVTDMSNSAFTILGSVPPDTSWLTQTSGTSTAFYSVKAVNQNIAWAGGGTGAGTSGFVRRTTDGGTTWTAAGTFAADVFCITALDANIAIAGNWTGTYSKLIKTTDGGATWRTVDSVGGTSAFYDNVHMFDNNNGIAQGDPVGGIWIVKKTTDGGNTWSPVVPDVTQQGTEAGWNNSMAWSGASGWFGTNSSHLYRSTDFGSTWTATGASTFANSYSVAFSSATNGLTGSDTGPVNKSTDGGVTWATVPGNLTAADLALWANQGSTEYWACSGLNVWYSANFGTSFSSAPNQGYASTQQTNHVDMVNIGQSLYGWMVGNAGTVARFRRISTGVPGQGQEIPTTFALSQNYPNPFNPTTQIKYDLPEQSTVSLKIYNILGQEVMTLANGEQAPGFYSVTWEGRNNFGSQVSSGVYFYRFEAKGTSGQTFSTLKKMLFLK